MAKSEPVITINDLPVKFNVKYLGWEPSRGLWGMKHTRKPVDTLVAKAKNLPPLTSPPRVTVEVTKDGFTFFDANKKLVTFKVDEISYGVQDLVFTRVFSMIVITNRKINEGLPFICHSFVCDSKNQARQLTYALAAVFKLYAEKIESTNSEIKVKKFAIDLRTPEQQAAEAARLNEDEETDV